VGELSSTPSENKLFVILLGEQVGAGAGGRGWLAGVGWVRGWLGAGGRWWLA